MSTSRLSVYGIYQYDNTIFDNMVIPESLDRETLLARIFMDSWDLECAYPFPDFLKTVIGQWSKSNIYNWEELAKTLEYEYNPIYNRFYESTDTETRDLKNSMDMNDAHTLGRNGTDSRNTSGTNDNTSIESTKAYNESDWTERNKTTDTGSRTGTENGSFTSDDDYEGSESRTGTDTGTITKTSKGGGNIGVTTTQKLINEQREIVKFNLYKYIANEFIKMFCIQVW